MQKTFVRILFYGALVLGTVNGHSLKAGPFEDGIAAIQGGDIETAYKILRPLAEHGHAPAQGILGILYRDGRVVKQDHKEAVKWFRKAAEGGDMRARTNLGIMYMRGHGTE